MDRLAGDLTWWGWKGGYFDADSDAYGNASKAYAACSTPTGYVSDDSDCDDDNSAVNPDATEIGTYELRLTPEGKADELFSVLPDTFLAQLGHKERAEVLPPGVVNLAFSDLVTYEAFRVPGKPIWATQFHPELDLEDHLVRFSRYIDIYAKLFTEEQIQEMWDRFKPSPEAEKLLPRFLELIT
jgi:hypothetical protein